MKKFTFLLFGFMVLSVYSQNHRNAYSNSSSSGVNVSDWIMQQERMELQRRDAERVYNNQKSNNTSTQSNYTERKRAYQTPLKQILIFGGEKGDVFLGCLNCDKFDSNSIWNTTGYYGSKFNKYSIWNKFDDFGGEYGEHSPFNHYSLTPPQLKDSEGNFYGYFTANTSLPTRANSDGVKEFLNKWKIFYDDIPGAYIYLFEQ